MKAKEKKMQNTFDVNFSFNINQQDVKSFQHHQIKKKIKNNTFYLNHLISPGFSNNIIINNQKNGNQSYRKVSRNSVKGKNIQIPLKNETFQQPNNNTIFNLSKTLQIQQNKGIQKKRITSIPCIIQGYKQRSQQRKKNKSLKELLRKKIQLLKQKIPSFNKNEKSKIKKIISKNLKYQATKKNRKIKIKDNKKKKSKKNDYVKRQIVSFINKQEKNHIQKQNNFTTFNPSKQPFSAQNIIKETLLFTQSDNFSQEQSNIECEFENNKNYKQFIQSNLSFDQDSKLVKDLKCDKIYDEECVCAVKIIQRAVRRYLSNKIKQCYKHIFYQLEEQEQSLFKQQQQDKQQIKKEDQKTLIIQEFRLVQPNQQQKIDISPSPIHFYRTSNNQQTKININISNIQQQQKYYDELKQLKKFQKIKQEELLKWNQMIDIIKSYMKKGLGVNANQILSKLAQQSQQNKKSLQQYKANSNTSLILSEQSFTSNPIQSFNSRRYRQIFNNDNINSLLHTRQKLLLQRERTQLKIIQECYLNKQIGQQKYRKRRVGLQKWVQRQRKEIQNTKRDIALGIGKAKQTIFRTQRDFLFMQKLKGQKVFKHSFSQQGLRTKYKIFHLNYIDSITSTNMNNFKDQINSIQDLKKKLPLLDGLDDDQNKELSMFVDLKKKIEYSDSSNSEFENKAFEISDQKKNLSITKIKLNIQQIVNMIFAEQLFQFLQGKQISQEIQSNQIFQINFKTMLHMCVQTVTHKKKKGIKTNLQEVIKYLDKFLSFLLGYFYQLDKKKNFLLRVNQPMSPTPKQMLSYMHQIQEQFYQNDEDCTNLVILHIQIYDQFQLLLFKQTKFSNTFNDIKKQEQRQNFLKSCIQIFHKLIFDAVNQALDYQRPWGMYGEPYPWKKHPQFRKHYRQDQLKNVTQNVKQRIIDWGSNYCGIISDKQQSNFPSNLSDTYIRQLRDDRLSRMMANQVSKYNKLYESSERWIFYDDEQTELLVECSQKIFQQLIGQFVYQYQIIRSFCLL